MFSKESKISLDATAEWAAGSAHGSPTMSYAPKREDAHLARGRRKHETNDDDRRRAVPVRLHSSLISLYLLDCIGDSLHIDNFDFKYHLNPSLLLVLASRRVQFFTIRQINFVLQWTAECFCSYAFCPLPPDFFPSSRSSDSSIKPI